jgi:hypothetical protein
MADLGKLWRPVVKGGAYPGGYFRTSGVAHSCKGKKTSDRSMQNCVREKMKGTKA